jgi:hypothetical protein
MTASEQWRYDVTAVSEARDYVPIAASVPELETAETIAANVSTQPEYSAVQVKRDTTRVIVATYVKGKRQPS